MKVVLVSMILYLAGVAVVLYLKPKFMFHADGRWKEFGLHEEERTLIPFWAFCITYAIFSYAVARIGNSLLSDHSTAGLTTAATTTAALSTRSTAAPKKKRRAPVEDSSSSEEEENVPDVRKGEAVQYSEKMKPGYYRLNTRATRKGVPQYIYLGAAAPSESSDEEETREA